MYFTHPKRDQEQVPVAIVMHQSEHNRSHTRPTRNFENPDKQSDASLGFCMYSINIYSIMLLNLDNYMFKNSKVCNHWSLRLHIRIQSIFRYSDAFFPFWLAYDICKYTIDILSILMLTYLRMRFLVTWSIWFCSNCWFVFFQ